jgi:uncharacterized protein (DUF302 family)
MHMMNIPLRRIRVHSRRPFDEALRAFTATIGRPDLTEFQRAILAAATLADLEAIVGSAVGPSQLMEFARFDSGSVLRKADGRPAPRILRLLVGNPLIMKEMARTVPDAAAYAPVTILIDERADGVRLSYDSMVSLLEPYGDEGALAVARDLDAKIENLMESAR